MKTYTTLLSIAVLAMVLTMGFTNDPGTIRYTFTSASDMRVEGTSTVHGWVADIATVAGSMEVSGEADLLNGGKIAAGSLTIPVAGMDTDNGTMNKKMFQALKADTHEKITFVLTSAELIGAPTGQTFRVAARGNLTLAGVQKPIELSLEAESAENDAIRLKGNHVLRMSEYGIKPPTAMLGTLKTGDEVTIVFDLVATPASS